ncbi:MAG: metallophosphoesterase [Leadbetterella sp.]|nr:metallophosphoesterase [Leadbetterella sp.]
MKKFSGVILLFFSLHFASAQEAYVKPRLENKDSWSVIMIPDPQNYAKWTRNQPVFDLMMAWIEENLDSLNVKMVVCTGDLVELDDIIIPGIDWNISAPRQWEYISNAFKRLDGKVPYLAAAGNHDYSINKDGERTTRYNAFFPADKNFLNTKHLVQNTRNVQDIHTLENSVLELKSLNGKDYLFMTLEYAPRDTVVSWARRVAGMEQYKNHRVVLLTHAYLNAKNERTTGENKWFMYQPYYVDKVVEKSHRITLPQSNNGQQIWEKLVYPSSNFSMVLCGHISGEGYRSDKNAAGKSVHQMLFDAQSYGGGHRDGNGGDGWLRILEFLPDNKSVKVKTFSPLFAISPTTQQHAWKRDAKNEFTMALD